MTGTSRYASQLVSGLQDLDVEVVPLPTRPTGLSRKMLDFGRVVGIDGATFLAQYPVALRWPSADVYHLSVQTYSISLLFNPPPGPVVVSAHDIIPYLVRRSRVLNHYRHAAHRLFDWLAMQGLRRADRLIADSNWTKNTIVQELEVPGDRISVIYHGVDHRRFQPLPVPETFRRRYSLPGHLRYVLYVGSEDRRKNLGALWQAMAEVASHSPDVRLLKVGAPSAPEERQRLVRLAADLGISHVVRFMDHVTEEDLSLFYNAATVCVMPSLYEGFGLPVVEAMACGTKVVCADAASLPEVAGGDALLCPLDSAGIAAAISECLAAGPAPGREERLAWAGQFSWRVVAKQTRDLYARLGTQPATQLSSALAIMTDARPEI